MALVTVATLYSGCDSGPRVAPLPIAEAIADLLSRVVAVRLEWAAWMPPESTIELTEPQRSRLIAWLTQTAAARTSYVPCPTAPYAKVRLLLSHGDSEDMLLDPVGIRLLAGAFGTSDEEQREVLDILREVTRTPAGVNLPWR